ncbi:MAG TPA: AAA family ATPase [Candidatus Eisenbacteria bacterium]|nr:AAA family ATPase [Candidatus Eisenbacteria bacterium]
MLGEVTSVEHGTPLRLADGGALDPLVGPQCSLAVQLRRATGAVIGRSAELDAISQELHEATGRLAAVTLEGEPGIGKTRLLLAAAEVASASGFTCVAITADEEIRGPFLVARSLFASSAIHDAAAGTPAEAAVGRVVEAISGRDERGFETLSPDAKLLRAFDLAGVAISALAGIRPLALLIDDVQWADDDTLRLLRYVVRSDADRPVFLFLTIRPDEFASVTEAVNFVADMERMGLVRRLRPGRFGSVETAELLKRVLGGPVEAASAAAMHVQSEGVPFIVEELARTHREAGTLQQIDGEWRLGRNAARLVPSAVRTLIDRRAARLPARTRAALGDAAILGRSFSLRDLRAIRARCGEGEIASQGRAAPQGQPAGPDAGAGNDAGDGSDPLADDLGPAVRAGLLLAQAQGEPADYTFSHEQVRQFAASQLTAARRRQVHAAVVDLLLEGGDPAPAGLPMLAQHALAAGDTVRAARFSIDAAAAALASNAPEEALRLVEQALPVVSMPADRRVLLATRDDAFAALRRTGERLDGLTELAALAEAMRDPTIELDVQLRRASALRMSHDEDAAAELARRVRTRAAEQGDAVTELRATIELGQALLRSSLGESFGGAAIEIDLEGGDEAYRRAIELAEQLHDDHSLAGALREIGTIDFARGRGWFSEQVRSGQANELLAMLSSGASIEELILASPVGPLFVESAQVLERALGIFERLGDRTGVMSTVIAMAYAQYGTVMHFSSSARHLEEIRRITSRLSELVTESERARLDLQMLFGVHVYSRAKVVPDLALSRAEDAYRAAKLLGDRSIEFLAAGGAAMSLLDLGDVAGAERWIGLAAAAASMAPSRTRARQLETWRGMARAGAGDVEGMRRHLEKAVAMATEGGRASAQCEALARLALESARLVPAGTAAGAAAGAPDPVLVELVERSAAQVKELLPLLPGHAPWGAQADAALATVALVRGDIPAAVMAGGAALQALQAGLNEDASLEIVVPAARAVFAGAPPEMQGFVRGFLQSTLSRIAQGTADEAIRVRWLTGPVGRGLVELAGPMEAPASDAATPGSAAHAAQPSLDDAERRLLQLLTEGRTNAEIAAELAVGEDEVAQRLARLQARLGTSSRAEATSLAFRGLAAVGSA